MSNALRAALVAAAIAAPLAATPAAADNVPAFTWHYYNVTLAVPRGGYNAKAMATAFCRAHLHKGVAEHTAAMINPGLAFFSYINCVGRTLPTFCPLIGPPRRCPCRCRRT